MYVDDGSYEPSYAAEYAPSISLNRSHIILYAENSKSPGENGLYYAEIGNPQREKLLAGTGYASPALASITTIAAFIDNGRIKYFDVNSKMISSSTLPAQYEAVAFLNDTVIVGARQDSLDIIYRRNDSILYTLAGYDPTMYRNDTIMYINFVPPNMYELSYLAQSIQFKSTSALTYFHEPLDTLLSTSEVRWYSKEPSQDRYAYAIATDTSFIVHSSHFSSMITVSLYISEIERLGPNMVDFNLIIFPGPDGRLYRSDYDGTDQFPYWGQAGNTK